MGISTDIKTPEVRNSALQGHAMRYRFGFKKFVPFIESLSFFESKSVRESENSGVKTVYFRLIA